MAPNHHASTHQPWFWPLCWPSLFPALPFPFTQTLHLSLAKTQATHRCRKTLSCPAGGYTVAPPDGFKDDALLSKAAGKKAGKAAAAAAAANAAGASTEAPAGVSEAAAEAGFVAAGGGVAESESDGAAAAQDEEMQEGSDGGSGEEEEEEGATAAYCHASDTESGNDDTRDCARSKWLHACAFRGGEHAAWRMSMCDDDSAAAVCVQDCCAWQPTDMHVSLVVTLTLLTPHRLPAPYPPPLSFINVRLHA